MLQNTDRIDVQTANGIVKNRSSGYTNFIQTFLTDKQLEESIPSFQKEVFGANLKDGDMTIDDLFGFMGDGKMEEEKFNGKPEVTLMNSFKHQGERFKEDPFSFKPEVPENYKPFEFGCMANRQTKRTVPVVTELGDNLNNFKKSNGMNMADTKAGTHLNYTKNGSGSILGSKMFNFTATRDQTSSPFTK